MRGVRWARTARRWLAERSGVRLRSALAAAVVVGFACVIAAAALVGFMRHSLARALDAQGREQATQVATRLSADRRGDLARDAQLAVESAAGLVQVIGADGTVLAASPQLLDRPPISGLRPSPGTERGGVAPWPAGGDGDEEDLLIASRGVHTLGGDVVVLVGTPVDSVDRATDAIVKLLLVGAPLLVMITGTVTYAATGRALRPVEAMRRRVAGLTSRDLSTRVPVPIARDEVHRLAETMNEMLARLQSAQQAQRRFVADASHELRSPLATVMAGLELGQRGGVLEESDWGTLRAEADRLAVLVDDLLLLARADERGLVPVHEDVDLDDLADAEGARLRTMTDLDVVVTTTPARVRGDRAQLGRVLRNLVDNARRHARSRIELTVRHHDGGAVMTVSDDGEGVPPDQRERIFERFVRLDESRERGAGGAGLGLAIVREVVLAHGGQVSVDEAPGGGAHVQVWLPTGN